MHFPCSAQLGIPQPQIVVHIKQLLKCLILSNLNCLLIELTFGYCFLSALHASWHSHPFRRQWIAMWDDAIKEQSQWRLSCLLFLSQGPLPHTSALGTAGRLAGADVWPLC